MPCCSSVVTDKCCLLKSLQASAPIERTGEPRSHPQRPTSAPSLHLAPAFPHAKLNKTKSVPLNAVADWLECDEADLWSKRLPAHFSAGMKCQRFSCGHRLHLAKERKKRKEKCPQAAGLNEQPVSVPADVSVRGCVRDAGVCLQVFSTSGFSVHFSLHRSFCFSPPNLSRLHSFTFNVLPSCRPAPVLFPAYSVMSPAFPTTASLCLFLWHSFPQFFLKLEFSGWKYFVSHMCSCNTIFQYFVL